MTKLTHPGKDWARQDDYSATRYRSRESALRLPVWFERAASPAPAKFVHNFSGRSRAPCLCRLPRRRQRVMQGQTLRFGKVVSLVIGNKIDDQALRQGRRLVEDETSFLDTGLQTVHIVTIGVCEIALKSTGGRNAVIC